MIEYLNDKSLPYWQGIVYTAVVVACSLLGSLANYHSQWQSSITGMKMRVVMMTAVYRKAMNLAKRKGDSHGQIVNLFAADSQLIFDGMTNIVPGLIAPLQLLGAVIFLGFYVSYYCLIVVGVFILSLPLTIVMGNNIAAYRRKIQSMADIRLKLTTEFVQGIRIVKYYAWEEPFMRNIFNARSQEMRYIRIMALLRALIIFLINNTSTLSLALTLLFYGLYGPGLSIADAFTIIAIMNVTRQPFSMASVSYVLVQYNKASIDRVGEFLASPEKEHYLQTDPDMPDSSIQVKDSNFYWEIESEPVLKGMNFTVHPGEKIMVVGKVGSGKSSLGMALLGEMPKISGSISVNGQVAYVPQQAWIYNATVRDNILFGEPYDQKKI